MAMAGGEGTAHRLTTAIANHLVGDETDHDHRHHDTHRFVRGRTSTTFSDQIGHIWWSECVRWWIGHSTGAQRPGHG